MTTKHLPNMKQLFVLFCLFGALHGSAQGIFSACGTETLRTEMLQNDPSLLALEQAQETAYQQAAPAAQKGTGAVLVLPVVVHIVHDGGPENISDAQVLKGIEHLNDAYRNRNYYNPATGADTEIEFCLARRDLQGNAFSGIVRHQSPLTDMSAFAPGNLYDLCSWDTKNYIRIILVRKVCVGGDCNTAGYATYGFVHGGPNDAIVMRAAYFGQDERSGVVLAHEMGHYLHLFHTFQSGCKNGDCLTEGDRVCDTPPDNSVAPLPCAGAYNSCTTDADDPTSKNPFRIPALGGLGDQNDMHRNYMDYSPYECYDRFTEGQKARMRFFIESFRTPLLSSKACLPPCPLQTTALFTADTDSVEAGGQVAVQNLSQHAAGYQWLINGTPVSTAPDTVFSFPNPGAYLLQLVALSPLPQCEHDTFGLWVTVYCPVAADFSYTLTADSLLVLTDLTANADAVQWTIKDGAGALLFSSAAPQDSFTVSGLQYLHVCLTAFNAYCSSQKCVYVKLVAEGVEICTNGLDDDGDGLADLFDPDCPCDNAAYQAYCPVPCEFVPDSFPAFSMRVKWVSEVIDDQKNGLPNIIVGDLNSDGSIEVVSLKSIGYWTNLKTSILILNSINGSTINEIAPKQTSSMVATADVDKDGRAELFSLYGDTIYCHTHDGLLIWKSDNLKDFRGRLVNISDFNEEGIPEIYEGNQIFNAYTGTLLVSGNAGAGCNKMGSSTSSCSDRHTIAADLLPTPGLELAAGNTVYIVEINNPDGTAGNAMTPVVAPLPVRDGFTSVGDIDGDGLLDVVVVRDHRYPDGGGIWAWNPRTGAVIASAPAGIAGGVPFVGDVTGDCTPEIGMTFQNELRMYRYDGTPQLKLLYSLPTTDMSGRTGITMFDFNQDGRQELVYRDETDLRILDGATGATLATYPMKSGTGMEYPVVADVDRDGQADILVNGYQTDSAGVIDLRVYCFESAGAPWAPARSVWNQYGYHVTNINDDLSVPRQPQNQAAHLPGHETCLQPTCPAPYNAFLAQATYRTQQGCVQFPASGDLALQALRYECSPDSLVFFVAVSNPGGTTVAAPCVHVACYSTPPGPGVAPVAVLCAPIVAVLPDTLRIALPLPVPAPTQMYFVVNDPGTGANAQNHPVTGILECDYTNNTDAMNLDLPERTLDIGPDTTLCASATITLNAGSGFVSYRWSDGSTGSIYSALGAGLHFIEAADGCGRVYRDTVLVTENVAATINLGPDRETCPGEALAFEAPGFDAVQWFSTATISCGACAQVQAVADSTYELIVVVARDGCYAADTVLVSVSPIVVTEQYATLCAGDTLAFLGAALTEAGRYEFPLNGCDSTVALNLVVQPLPEKMAAFALCPGDSVLVGAAWLSGTGLHEVRVSANGDGCDTVFRVSISETLVLANTETVTICAGDSVLVFGQWVREQAVLSQTFASAAGCDSVQEYRVLVLPLPEKTAAFALCPGDSVLVGAAWLSGAGLHEVRVSANGDGCDTIFQVSISETPVLTNTETLTICAGDSVLVFGQWVHEAATLSQTFTSAAGCDSVQEYRVLMQPLPERTAAFALCPGDSVLVGAAWLSGAGLHEVRVSANGGGCDTVFQVSISETPVLTNTETLTICAGDSVLVFGQWVHEAATLSQTFMSAAGCDSVQEYRVLVQPLPEKTAAFALCPGDSVLVGAAWLSGAGLHEVRVSATGGGCDTIFQVSISETPVLTNTETLTICAGDSVLVFGQWVHEAAVLSQTFMSAAGCDSVQEYRVLVQPLPEKTAAFALCPGDSVLVGAAWLSGAGLHEVRVSATGGGCDTVFQVSISETPVLTNIETLTICAGDSVLVFGQWVHEAATLSQTFTSAAGCDSMQEYRVLVQPLPEKTAAFALCPGDSVLVGAAWLSGAGLHEVRVSATGGGCDTVVQVSISEIPLITNTETLTICSGDSVLVFGQWVREQAVLSQTFMSAAGCDSVQEYRVLVQPLPERTAAFALCPGDSVLVGAAWLSGAGLHEVRVSANGGGCDTVFRVTITQLPNAYRTDTLTLCPGDSVLVAGEWITGPDERTLIFAAANGCDSLFTLSLRIALAPAPQLPGDTVLRQGQALLLDLGLNPANWSVQWQPAELFSCDTCVRTVLRIGETVEVEVVYTDRGGCVFSHRFLVVVQKKADLYVPNVFSPNDDGSNDTWTVIAPPGGVFEEVSVWSRWGELLWMVRDVPRVDWDGGYRGKPLDAAVFVWYIRYRDPDGEMRILKGDVTLVR